MSKLPSMLDDKRCIDAVYFLNEDGQFRAGQNCERIEIYGEPGQGAWVPYIAIIKNSQIEWRIPANYLQIHYATEPKP